MRVTKRRPSGELKAAGWGEDRSVTLPIRLTSIDLGCQIPKLPHILHETSV